MPSGAPYQQIVAEIRDRIVRGELRPGDRVPSTRQITQEWGVAMATATKVISALRDEGVVDARPGAGTVVRAAEPDVRVRAATRAVRREPEPRRDRIVAAAIAVADAEGLAPLSMRRVATELGVATMSLYRHVPSKDELLLFMVDAAFGESIFPQRPPGWRERLTVLGRLMWTVFRRHPWAAEILSLTRPQVVPNLMEYAEWSLGGLTGLGLDPSDLMHTHLVLFGHVRGTALSLQSETQARQDTGLTNNEWMETQGDEMDRLIATGHFPALTAIMGTDFEYDLDAVFEYGLQLLLDGIAARLSRPGATAPRSG